MARACTGAFLTLLATTAAEARVTRIVVDETTPLTAPAGSPASPIAYEQLAGRAFGELDPKDPRNALITDIDLAKDADGKVRYVASFVMGWNITAAGDMPLHKDQICDYVGGMIPFAKTADERKASNDPRASLQERYGSHDGYVEAVRKASARAKSEGFLLDDDAVALIRQAEASAVLR